jgi:cysteine-rich repeat protein
MRTSRWHRVNGFAALLLAGLAVRAVAQVEVVPAFDAGSATFSPLLSDVDVSAGADGTFIVFWREYAYPDLAGGSRHAVTRRFSEAGVALGPAVKIDSSAHVVDGMVHPDKHGGYVASWNWVRSGIDYAFFGVFLDAAGVRRGPDFRITLPNNLGTIFGASVGLRSGSVFLWNQFGLWGRLHDVEGQRKGGDFLISELSSGIYRIRAAATADGGFVATWQDFYSTPANAVWARLFGPDAQPRGDAQLVAVNTGFIGAAGSPTGPVAIVVSQWDSTANAYEIRAYHFAANGTALGDHLVHAADPGVDWITVDPEFDLHGNLYVVWTEYNNGRPASLGRIFDVHRNPVGPAVPMTAEDASSVSTARLVSGRFVNAWRNSRGIARANIVALCAPGSAVCGDGVVQAVCEECDNGAGNSDTLPDACRTACRVARCGDGILDSGEECDDGNTNSCDGCSSRCESEVGATCGDGVRLAACGEECDAGVANSATIPDACRPDCRLPTCGDGVLDAGEECDDSNTHDCDGCRFDCRRETAPAGQVPLCDPLPYAGLTPLQLASFDTSRAAFMRVRHPATGLGPVFNGASCAECHSQPTVGGSSPRFVTRFGRSQPSGTGFDPLTELGGPLLQAFGIDTGSCSVAGEVVPSEATFVGRRDTPPLFGLGLIEGIPDREILRNEDLNDRNRDGISGRASRLPGARIGRFGWKAQVASLHDFATQAYLDEMGITTPFLPHEHNPQGGPVLCDDLPDPEDDGENVMEFVEFIRLLAPLPTPQRSREARRGKSVFKRLRCHRCHTDKLRAGPAPVPSLTGKKIPLFSDLLLHDMGPALADGIVQGGSGSEFRTPPLWGVRWSAPYLHDGRASTLEEAIAAHGGEATQSRSRFDLLSSTDKAALIAFLNSL